MAAFRRFLTRRWLLAVLGVSALVFGLAMLHPYPRQSLFGPTIRGKPWCYWEDEVRRSASGKLHEVSWINKSLAKLGLLENRMPDLTIPELLPVFISLANDDDPTVRRYAVLSMHRWAKSHPSDVLVVFRQHRDDDDPRCRITSAYWIWKYSKDKEIKKTAMLLANHADPWVRTSVASLLGEMIHDDPEVLDHLTTMADDTEPEVRFIVTCYIRNGDGRRIGLLKKAMQDPSSMVRRAAFQVAVLMKKEATPLLAALIAAQNDPDPDIKRDAAAALITIDPDRFQHLKGERKIE